MAEKTVELFQKYAVVNRLKNINCEFQKGATWFSITKEFATYIVSKKQWIMQVFSNTRSSDEVFVQTLLHNSMFEDKRFEDTYEIDGLTGIRYIDWKRGKPYTFEYQDWQELMECGFLFARKFSIKTDRKIIEMLHEHILAINRTDAANV